MNLDFKQENPYATQQECIDARIDELVVPLS